MLTRKQKWYRVKNNYLKLSIFNYEKKNINFVPREKLEKKIHKSVTFSEKVILFYY